MAENTITLRARVARWLLGKKGLYELHPELLERQPLIRLNSDQELQAAGGTSFAKSVESYTYHMWVQKAINVLANNIAPLPLTIKRGDDEIDNHPARVLLDNPNPEMAPEDLWREWVVDQMLGGEWGLEVTANGRGQPVELWPRQANQFTVKPESYRYRRVAYYTIDDGMDAPYQLKPDEFIHFKFYNPQSPFRGLAPITAVRLSIAIDQLAQAWTRLFFRNQARPDYAVIAPEGVTRSEKIELENHLAQKFGTNEGVHKPIILESGVTDIKTFSYPPKDLEWVSQREFSRDEVAAIFGVPDEIMGYGRDTYENFATAEEVLWSLTIIPLCGLRDGILTRYLRRKKMLLQNERVATNLSEVQSLQGDHNAEWARAREQMDRGAMTINEWRESQGLEPYVWGSVWWAPMSLTPVSSAEIEDEPEPGTTPATDQARAIVKTIYGSLEHETIWKRRQIRLDSFIAKIQRIVKREFQRQQSEIDRKLRDSKTYGRGKFVEFAKEPERIPSPEEMFDLEAEIKKFIDVLRDPIVEAVQKIGQNEFSVLGIEGVFDITIPQVAGAIRDILQQVARKTNNTTWLSLVEIFQAAEAAGEGIVAIQERLALFWIERKSSWQTERIARTTMTGAANMADREAWAQTGVVAGREWVSALQPDRTREEHAIAHGQQVGLNEPFSVGGELLDYPGDPAGSAEAIINCLCTTTPVLIED